MKALIIYDSFFGNTEQVAQTIGKTLGTNINAEVIKIDNVDPEKIKGIDVLIIGSPTRAFSPTKKIMQFLKKIPSNSLAGIKAAAFDTRVSLEDVNSKILNLCVKLFGYAAESIEKMLIKKGAVIGIPKAGFIVKGTEGPLKEGENERAAGWVKKIS